METIFINRENIKKFNQIQDIVVAIGQFDGVHIAHQQLIKRVRDMSLKNEI